MAAEAEPRPIVCSARVEAGERWRARRSTATEARCSVKGSFAEGKSKLESRIAGELRRGRLSSGGPIAQARVGASAARPFARVLALLERGRHLQSLRRRVLLEALSISRIRLSGFLTRPFMIASFVHVSSKLARASPGYSRGKARSRIVSDEKPLVSQARRSRHRPPHHEPPAAAWIAGSRVARPKALSCCRELMKKVGTSTTPLRTPPRRTTRTLARWTCPRMS